MIKLASIRTFLRRIAGILLPPFLLFIALVILGFQFTEFTTRSEILSLSSFIVLLSFSALAFNWCRVSPSLANERVLEGIYQAAVDLFLASLMTLVATFFAWLKTSVSLIPAAFYPGLFAIHWLFLLLGVGLFLIALLNILRAVREIERAV